MDCVSRCVMCGWTSKQKGFFFQSGAYVDLSWFYYNVVNRVSKYNSSNSQTFVY
jgi:hypothetical protein